MLSFRLFRRVRARATAMAMAVLLTLGLAVEMLPPVQPRPAEAQTDPEPAAASKPVAPLTRPDAVSARVTARASGRRVEVLSDRGEATTTWANPDGTFTTDRHAGPIRVFDPDDKTAGPEGSWRDIDTDLISDGSVVRPKVAKADMRFSGGGSGPAAWLGVGERSLAMSWPLPLPAPTLSGPAATYADVLPGADLVLAAAPTGFAQRLVLRRQPLEPLVVRLPLRLDGLTVSQHAASGQLRFAARDGTVAASANPAVMWDATTTDLDGDDPARVVPAATRIVDTPAGPVLEVTPDTAFLADPATRYPVTIDPSPTLAVDVDTMIRSDLQDANYHDHSYMRLGARDGGSWKYRSLVRFNTGTLNGKHILNAKLHLYEVSSGSCTKRKMQVRRLQEAFKATEVTWRNQPAAGSTVWAQVDEAQGYSDACPNAWIDLSITDLVQYWADGAANHGMQLRAYDENFADAYKSFTTEQTDKPPYLTVTYNSYPKAVSSRSPASGSYVNTTRPELHGIFSDPDGGTGKVVYEIYGNASGAHVYTRSSSGDFVASGSDSPWKVPSAAGLSDGVTYKWRARGWDGTDYTKSYSSWFTFTVDTTKPAAPQLSSTTHPDATVWYASGDFSASWPAVSDASGLAGYAVALDKSSTTLPTTLQTARTYSKTVDNGSWWLHVRAKDNAGNYGPTTHYKFNVGQPEMTAPADGDRTIRRQTLQANGPASLTGATLQYRIPGGAWADIPSSTVTDSANQPIAGWPVTMTDGLTPLLVWDAPATAGLAAYSGPLKVRAKFTDGTYSSAGGFTLDQNAYGGDWATTDIGPGTVNPMTGDFALDAVDVSIASYGSDLTVARSYHSRGTGVSDPLFGPGWTSGVGVFDAGADYTSLETELDVVQIGASDGTLLFFTKNGDTFVPDEGYEALTLTYDAAADRYQLTDLDGTTTTFAKQSDTYQPTSVTQTGDGNTTSYRYEPAAPHRVTRVLAPTANRAACLDADLTLDATRSDSRLAGCRLLDLAYSDVAIANGTVSRLTAVTFTAWEPGQNALRTDEVARYDYDTSGRLAAAWDPRISPALKTSYGYTDGYLATVTPPAEEAWTLSYVSTTAGDANAGRLRAVSRPSLLPAPDEVATTTLVYGVPLAGTSAPSQMGAADVAVWAQTDVPTDATAVFPANAVPASTDPAALTAGDYAAATVHYLNRDAREVNTAEPGGHITTSEYDEHGNVIRELTAANRARTLAAADSTAEAQAIDSQYRYSDDGLERREELGPRHRVQLSSGEIVDARQRTTYTYDEGAPTTGGPYHLPTTITVAAAPDGRADTDARTTKTDYDWTLRQPTREITDPAGLNLIRTILYDPTTGLEVERRMPSEPNGGGAGNTKTIYYTATVNSSHPECGDKPWWANLVCKTLPAAQPGTAGLPDLPVITATAYNRLGHAVTTRETVGSNSRTTTLDYDAAGRVVKEAISSDVGEPLPPIRTIYDDATGYPVRTETLGDLDAVTATITRTYDTLGQVTKYVDAEGNVATTSYDILGRPAATNDGKGSQTYNYDPNRGALTKLEDSHAGTFTAAAEDYDPDGTLLRWTLPNGMAASQQVDETGAPLALDYTQTVDCTSDCAWLSDSAIASIHGQWLAHDSTLSSRAYRYDAAGRLTHVEDTVADQCGMRDYTFDANSNRKSLVIRPPAADGTCQPTATGTTTNYSHDSADRLTDPGYSYDAFGRTLTVPAAHAGGGDLSATYHVNDYVRSLAQDGVTQTFTLDPNRRPRTREQTGGDGQTHTYRYADDSDSPAWMVQSSDGSHWTRNIIGLTGDLAAIQDNTSGTTLQLANLHGDVIAEADAASGGGLRSTANSDEYGNPRTSATSYGWLGAEKREAVLSTGAILMGVRLYIPSLGRFLQVDPLVGGSANSYDYANQDPINVFDLDGRHARGHRKQPETMHVYKRYDVRYGDFVWSIPLRWGNSRFGYRHIKHAHGWNRRMNKSIRTTLMSTRTHVERVHSGDFPTNRYRYTLWNGDFFFRVVFSLDTVRHRRLGIITAYGGCRCGGSSGSSKL